MYLTISLFFGQRLEEDFEKLGHQVNSDKLMSERLSLKVDVLIGRHFGTG